MKLDHTSSGSGAARRALVLRRVEKPAGSSGLDGKHEHRAGSTPTVSVRGGRAGLFRFDANDPSRPSQYGIPAGFVAQVLGQAMESKPESPTVATRVYARSARSLKAGRLIRVL